MQCKLRVAGHCTSAGRMTSVLWIATKVIVTIVIATKVIDYFQGQKNKLISLEQSGLTEREKEILHLLIEGLSYKELSAKIFISVETLNSHIKNIYRKLNVHSRSELTAKYGNT